MTVTLSDAPTLRAAAPYTFFLPHPQELSALEVGDLVKLIFEYDPPGKKWGAERMWVEITEKNGSKFVGRVDNEPVEEFISVDDRVDFNSDNVIAIFRDDGDVGPAAEQPREYWDLCLVDKCVLDGSEPVDYLYREASEAGVENDSGWRIRGRQGNASDDAMATRETSFVAIGAVLNKDDSWLALVDASIGSSYRRDFRTDTYIQV